MKTVLITGASSGLGAKFAEILAPRVKELVLVARSEERLKSLASTLSKKHGVSCHVILSDLSKAGSARQLFDDVKSRKLLVDTLINNAGYGMWGAFAQSKFEDMAGMIQLNVNSLTELTHLFLPDMIKRKDGRILNVASTAAFQPGPYMGVYYATKAYVLSFGEALAEELRGTGVSATTFCPGPTRTEFFDRAKVGNVPLKKMLTADAMACAKTGINGMLKRRAVVVDGVANWMVTLTARFFPRIVVRRIVAHLNAATLS